MRAHRHNMAGFSLVEMVAALVIFSLAVLGTVEVFSACLHLTSVSLNYTHAVMLAQKLMEETIAEEYFIAASDSGDFGEEYSGHSWQREVEESDTPGLYQIEVVVTWTERGREKEYALTTLVAERD